MKMRPLTQIGCDCWRSSADRGNASKPNSKLLYA